MKSSVTEEGRGVSIQYLTSRMPYKFLWSQFKLRKFMSLCLLHICWTLTSTKQTVLLSPNHHVLCCYFLSIINFGWLSTIIISISSFSANTCTNMLKIWSEVGGLIDAPQIPVKFQWFWQNLEECKLGGGPAKIAILEWNATGIYLPDSSLIYNKHYCITPFPPTTNFPNHCCYCHHHHLSLWMPIWAKQGC